jgi:chemotaxis protein MotB
MSHGGDDGGIPEEHEEHVNHEAWVIPYADLLTLLMAMFIALFAISNTDANKFQALSRGFSNALGGGKLDSGIGGSGKATSPLVGGGNGSGPFEGGQITPGQEQKIDVQKLASILTAKDNLAGAKAQERATLEQVERAIKDKAASLGFGKSVRTEELDNGLKVTLLTQDVLFNSGSADLRTEGAQLLEVFVPILQAVPNPLQITGYTDSDPIVGVARFPSNDELSFSRALAVKRYLVAHGIVLSRVGATGNGAENPIAPNDTAAHKQLNRRVEIFVQSKLVKQKLEENGLDGKKVTPTTTPISPPVSNPVDPTVDSAKPKLGISGG